MPVALDHRIANIISKARLLTERYSNILAQRDLALAKIDELTAEVNKQQKEIEKLKAQVDYLRISSTIGSTKTDIEQTRHFVSELVWEIDKCIKQLSN